MTYFRATDPFPLESADDTGLHEFYTRLSERRLVTTSCGRCGRVAWPPRRFCPECVCDEFRWVELPHEGVVHGFTIQEAGLPEGFAASRVFAIVKVDAARIFAPIIGPHAATVHIGARVRLSPVRVADDAKGRPRYVVAFDLGEAPG